MKRARRRRCGPSLLFKDCGLCITMGISLFVSLLVLILGHSSLLGKLFVLGEFHFSYSGIWFYCITNIAMLHKVMGSRQALQTSQLFAVADVVNIQTSTRANKTNEVTLRNICR